MLSILIPVFNYDVRQLVHELRRQAGSFSAEWEILCFDDGSEQSWKAKNRQLDALPGVRYRELPENLGRSRIRNLLADEARGAYLLFLDCDSEVPDGSYLQRYAAQLHPGTLLYGGRAYQPSPPEEAALCFHWLYGSRREAQPASMREVQPYQSFMTNNFLIPRAIFQQIRFDERLLQYGHEDTLFGLELKKTGVRILHLDNPLVHAGLEPVDVFLAKTRQGIQNLAFLYRSGSEADTRLLRFYRRLRRWVGLGLLRHALRFCRPAMARQLHSSHPSLLLFDLYKFSLLLDELKEE